MYWTIETQPENKGFYLCTCGNNVVMLYFNGKEWIEGENIVSDKVIAFRSLPQPYQPTTTDAISDKIDILSLRLNILKDLLPYTNTNLNDKIANLLDDTIMHLGSYISIAKYEKEN